MHICTVVDVRDKEKNEKYRKFAWRRKNKNNSIILKREEGVMNEDEEIRLSQIFAM